MSRAIIEFGPNGPRDVKVTLEGIEHVSPKKIILVETLLLRQFKEALGVYRRDQETVEKARQARLKEIADEQKAVEAAEERERQKEKIARLTAERQQNQEEVV